MHNWRFLLLAFVAVFQPIASFTERGDVDGRRQRCDYRAASLLRDSGLHFHGTYCFTKPAFGDRRLNQREDVREIHHNEVRKDSVRTPPQRRLAGTLERVNRIPTSLDRFFPAEYRLTKDAAVLSRNSRGAQHRTDHRDERSEIGRQRSIYRIHQTALDNRLSQAFDDERRIPSRRSGTSRFSMESRRESQRNRDNTEAHRAREIRQTIGVSDRVRVDVTNARRIARERTPRMDMRISESRLHLEQNVDRGMEHSRNTEFRSSLTTSVNRVNRAYENEESRLVRRDVRHFLDQEERRTQSRRILDNENLNRNIRLSRDSTLRDRISSDQIIIRGSSVRNAKTRDLKSDQPLENRRKFSNRDSGDQVFETQRENRNIRHARAKSFQENRVSQKDSQNTERERSVETRRVAKDTRGMETNVRSVERAIENQNQRDFHWLNRENRRDVRNIARDSRTIGLQRDADNRRATREVRRESPLGRNRITERNIRMDFGNIRSIENMRSIESRRDTRSAESRRITIENDSRRDTRNNERRSRSFDHVVDSQRDTRENMWDAHTLRQKRSSETRDSRTQRDFRAFTRKMTIENQRSGVVSVNRQSRAIGEERSIENRRASPKVERNSRSFRRESSVESGRTFLLERSSVNRRSAESRREIRNIEKDFRAVHGEEARGVESRIKNIVRTRDGLSMVRNGLRATERLNMRERPVDSRRSRSVQRESQRVSERNSLGAERREANYRFNTELTRKRELLSATRNPTENETSTMNWQYLFYMLQGLYLCGILTQLMNEKRTDMKTRTQSWWSAPQHLIKVD